jgi:hypothetical protein
MNQAAWGALAMARGDTRGLPKACPRPRCEMQPMVASDATAHRAPLASIAVREAYAVNVGGPVKGCRYLQYSAPRGVRPSPRCPRLRSDRGFRLAENWVWWQVCLEVVSQLRDAGSMLSRSFDEASAASLHGAEVECPWNTGALAAQASKSANFRTDRGSRSASRSTSGPRRTSSGPPTIRASISSTTPRAMRPATRRR